MKYTCECCDVRHDGKYGSGRFCSVKCAKSFATKSKRAEINQAVSKSLAGRKARKVLEHEKIHRCRFCDKGFVKAVSLGGHVARCPFNPDRVEVEKARAQEKKRAIEHVPFDDLPGEWKRAKVLEDQGGKCNRCGIKKWNGELIVLELEHIDGDNQNNQRENLELLCPNCHSQTGTWRGRNKSASRKASVRSKVTDKEYISALEECSSIRQALLKLGLSPRGNNYRRANRLIKEHGIDMYASVTPSIDQTTN